MTLKTMTRVAAAALTLALAAPALSGAAYAFDSFGGDETLVLKSAQSARYPDPNDTPLARATAEVQLQASHLATNAPVVVGHRDLVGEGGPQDEMAREIYHPGSGTNAD